MKPEIVDLPDDCIQIIDGKKYIDKKILDNLDGDIK